MFLKERCCFSDTHGTLGISSELYGEGKNQTERYRNVNGSSALNISTGPLALRTFQTAGPVHCIFHWPGRTTELNVGPVD